MAGADRSELENSEPAYAAASAPLDPDSAPGTPAASSVSSGADPQSAVPPIVPPASPSAGSGSSGPPKRSIADVLEDIDLSVPGAREKAVAEIQAMEEERRLAGIARARELGLPLREESPDGTIKEVVGIDEGGQPLYFVTYNANAAISTGANLLQASPYSLDGQGLILGVWDGGSARWSHQEFGGRVTVKDGSAPVDHATHVAGTMIASGFVPAAKGMATAATVYSYDWNNDKSEMIVMGAALSSDATKAFISNHSYGYLRGWNYTGNNKPAKQPPRVWEWRGTGTNATLYNAYFGLYSESARDSDAIACSAPYYLMFRAAGNDRNDNPTDGQAVFVPGNSNVVSYSQALHPPGDGLYRDGFDTIANDALAKNVVTIGSVSAAVSDGARDVSQASVSSFSCWGPTDDGRIKPDLVADGQDVYSCLSGNSTAYGIMRGTSMAAPNASGTAALVLKEYMNLFGGAAMRASTLKGLLIHTADDLGNPGPDYKYGWGLVNGQAAVDLVRGHKNKPDKARISEKQLTTRSTSLTQDFYSDGVSPIRVTLCWTDPAGAAVTTTDLRSPRLRNDLNLKVTGPDGSQHLPYVMPFVGAWTQQSMDSPAVTGTNKTDNVEQVYIAAPPAPGAYRATVSFRGSLVKGQQNYSLLISSDSASTVPPPATLSLASVFPNSGFAGSASFLLRLNGVSLATANSVKLTRAGMLPIVATNLSVVGQTLWCYVNLFAAPAGTWTVEVGSASGTTTLAGAFEIKRSIYTANFDGPVTGWRSSSALGTNSWALASDSQQPGASAYFAAAPAGKTTTLLTSPSISIPAAASNLQLKFRHSYSLEPGRDGARLQISVDDGATWFDTDDADAGVAFASNDYGAKMAAGEPANLGDFAGKQAWSGSSGGLVETVLNLTDNAKFSGKTVRFRWVLATDASNASASTGWTIDDVLLVDEGDFTNQGPSITSVSGPAETETDADGNTIRIVRGASADFGVIATDDAGESALVYTWSAQGPTDAPEVFFSPNGDNAARNTTAHFERAGDYLFTISAHDGQELAAAKSVMVRVMAVATQVEVDPENASVTHGGSLQFAASLVDQFGDPVAEQPASFTWSSSTGGSVSSGGLFTADSAGGPFAVTATSGAFAGVASITANNSAFDSWCLENFGAAWESDPADPRFAPEGDADGDGCPNSAEYYLGLRPGDPSSRLSLKLLSVDPAQRRVVLEISPVVTTGSFALQTSSSMSGDWGPEEPVYVPQADSSGALDVPVDGAKKFYRILFRPPPQ